MDDKKKFFIHAGAATEFVRQYIRQQTEYAKLDISEHVADMTTGLVRSVVLLAIGLLAAVFLLAAAGFALSEWMGSLAAGFGILGGILLLIFFIVLAFRQQLFSKAVLWKDFEEEKEALSGKIEETWHAVKHSAQQAEKAAGAFILKKIILPAGILSLVRIGLHNINSKASSNGSPEAESKTTSSEMPKWLEVLLQVGLPYLETWLEENKRQA